MIRRATMDRHPKGSVLLSWRTKSNLSPHSFVGTHSYLLHSSPQNPHYPVQGPPTSHPHWSEKRLSYSNSGIKTLELTPPSPYTIQAFTPSHTLPRTLIYKCLNHLNFLFLAGQPTKRAHQYPMWMGDGMGGLPRALWKSHWEPATIPPPSSSTISHTNISFTTHQTLSSISYTANSHAHSHTTDHLHHTNTTTPTTTFITPTPPHQLQVLSPLTHPSHPPNNHAWKMQKKSARTTSTASTRTTSITMSINMSAPTILPKKQLSRRTKQSAQITIPKKHPPTLSPLFQLISG